MLLVYAACCLATVELRRRDVRADGIPFRVPGAQVIPWLALSVILGLLATLTAGEWLAVVAVLVVAIPIYLLRARRNVPVAAPAGD